MTDLSTLTTAELLAAWQAAGADCRDDENPEVEAIAAEMERRGIDFEVDE